MGRVIVCDVIETMLDLRALDPHFERIFGDRAARQEWFQQMLQSAFVATITHVYADFGTIGKAPHHPPAQDPCHHYAQQDRLAGSL